MWIHLHTTNKYVVEFNVPDECYMEHSSVIQKQEHTE